MRFQEFYQTYFHELDPKKDWFILSSMSPLREMMYEHSPALFESSGENYQEMHNFLEPYCEVVPVVGQIYHVLSFSSVPVAGVFSYAVVPVPAKLLSNQGSYYIFDVRGKPKSIPAIKNFTKDLLSGPLIFDDEESMDHFIMLLNVKFGHWKLHRKINEGKKGFGYKNKVWKGTDAGSPGNKLVGCGEDTPPEMHRVRVQFETPMGKTVSKNIQVKAGNCQDAISAAVAHYERKGNTVKSHKYLEMVEQLEEYGMTTGGMAMDNSTGATQGGQVDNAAQEKAQNTTTQSINKLSQATGTKVQAGQTAKSLTLPAGKQPSPQDNQRNAAIAQQLEPLLADPTTASKLTSMVTQQKQKLKTAGGQ